MDQTSAFTWVTQSAAWRSRRVMRELELRATSGPDRGAKVRLAEHRTRVGALPGNTLVLREPTVSGHHCELEVSPGGVQVRDLASRNGTFIRGVRVTSAYLEPGAPLRLGKAELVLEAHGDLVEIPAVEASQLGPLLGRSVAARELFAQVERVAHSDASVLITGETGTGKELVAEAIVELGPRAAGPLVVVDCGALSPTLVESELFGHERGAFTGAERTRAGAFERAHGGTLLLDELGELPLALQPKLLRVLERGEVQRLGGKETLKVDVRVLAATHRRLEVECNAGRFRPDLFYRVSVLRIDVPPLRDRREDIALLAQAFLREATRDPSVTLPPEVAQQLETHAWPGNVRELRNAIERFAVGMPTLTGAAREPMPPTSGADLVPELSLEVPFRVQKERLIRAFEQRYVQALRAHAQGNLSKAARQAGMDRMAVVKLLARTSDGTEEVG